MSTRKKVFSTGLGTTPAAEPHLAVYVLRLYVAGATVQSTRAIVDARRICEEHLSGQYQLKVIDIYQCPALARDEQIIAVPTLVRHFPKPLRRLVGNLSNSERILAGLDLPVH